MAEPNRTACRYCSPEEPFQEPGYGRGVPFNFPFCNGSGSLARATPLLPCGLWFLLGFALDINP